MIARMTDEWTNALAASLDDRTSISDRLVDSLSAMVITIRIDPALVNAFSERGRSVTGRIIGTSGAVISRAHLLAQRVLGLALIQGFAPISDDPDQLRTYMRDYVVAPILKTVPTPNAAPGRNAR